MKGLFEKNFFASGKIPKHVNGTEILRINNKIIRKQNNKTQMNYLSGFLMQKVVYQKIQKMQNKNIYLLAKKYRISRIHKTVARKK